MDATQLEKLFFVVNHFAASEAGQGIIFHEEDGLFRTDLLAITAENAAQHVNLEFLGRLLDVSNLGRSCGAGRNYSNRFGWTDKFAKLTRHTFRPAVLVL